MALAGTYDKSHQITNRPADGHDHLRQELWVHPSARAVVGEEIGVDRCATTAKQAWNACHPEPLRSTF
jgi:hypothetical protein